MDLTVSYVLVIAWAQVPHLGYWHGSGLEPSGLRNRSVTQEILSISNVPHSCFKFAHEIH